MRHRRQTPTELDPPSLRDDARMTLILDAGALIARERNDRAMWRRLKTLAEDGDDIATSDPDDLEPLVALLHRHFELLRV